MGIHGGIISKVFHDKSVGSDLLNAEIKTTISKELAKYTIYHKDLLVPYIIFWNKYVNEGCIMYSEFINNTFTVKTGIYHIHAMRLSFFQTNDINELKREYDRLISQTHLDDFWKVK